jgi:hypothetical protein
VLLRDTTADVEPEPEARDVRFLRVRSPAERLEDLLGDAGRQPDASVSDPQQDARLFPLQVDVDLAVGRGVLGGVVQEVDDDLLDAVRVERERLDAVREVRADALAGLLHQPGDDVPDQHHEVGRAEPERQRALLEPRDVQ